MFAAVTLGGLGAAFGALAGSIVIGLVVELSSLVDPERHAVRRGARDPHPRPAVPTAGHPRPRRRASDNGDHSWTGPASSPTSPARSSRPTTAAYALAAIGLNIHFGLTGLLNMGQAGFMLLGAYGFAIATIAGLPLLAAVLVAIACAVVFALILGIPTLKLRGDYLAIVTIAAAEIVRIVGRSTTLTDLTGASQRAARQQLQVHVPGRVAVPRRHARPSARSSTRSTRRTAGGSGSSAGPSSASPACFVWLLMRSPWGRVLKGIREDEDAVRSLGKNVYSYKMQSLVLGGVIGALGRDPLRAATSGPAGLPWAAR